MNTALKRISSLAALQMRYEDELEAAEKEVKKIKDKLRQVSEDDLPEAMESVEMSEFVLEDGSSIKISDKYVASIPSQEKNPKKHAKALKWLRDHGFDGLIKQDVTVSFAKGEEKKAAAVIKQLNTKGYRFKNKEGVHAGTLKAFIKEQLEEGTNIPLDLFQADKLTFAKITRPKV